MSMSGDWVLGQHGPDAPTSVSRLISIARRSTLTAYFAAQVTVWAAWPIGASILMHTGCTNETDWPVLRHEDKLRPGVGTKTCHPRTHLPPTFGDIWPYLRQGHIYNTGTVDGLGDTRQSPSI